MGVVQRTGAGSKPRIFCVVSKSDRDHGIGYYDNRTLGLTPAGTICHSTRSLSLYPILRVLHAQPCVGQPKLETFIGVGQNTGAGSKPRIFRVVSKSDRDHEIGYYGNRTLGLTPADTICHSTRSLSLYPILRVLHAQLCVGQPKLETFNGVGQNTGAGSKPRLPCVVSKTDSDHGTANTA